VFILKNTIESVPNVDIKRVQLLELFHRVKFETKAFVLPLKWLKPLNQYLQPKRQNLWNNSKDFMVVYAKVRLWMKSSKHPMTGNVQVDEF
jgi:hypothetical protein